MVYKKIGRYPMGAFGICWSADLDLQFHMNNARYLRCADFGRIKFWYETGVIHLIQELGGSLVVGAINVRYRRSLKFGDIYTINTRILYWDSRSFYMEQSICRLSDGFICCVLLVKQSMVGVTVQQVLDKIRPAVSQPEPLPELTSWIEAIEMSSDRLKKTK